MADKDKKVAASGESGSASPGGQEQASSEIRHLYRSVSDRYIAGVCGGFAEYFNIDPNLVRIVWAILALMGGIGVVAYIAAWIIVPENPEPAAVVEKKATPKNAGMVAGIILIALGLALLGDQLNLRYMFPWGFNVFDSGVLLALFIIGAGLYIN